MIKLISALGIIAAAAISTVAMAQPYDQGQGQGRYCDDQGRCSDRAADVRDDSRDSSYDDRAMGRDRDDGDQYTGRVGAHWVDAYGRRCAWREVSFRDNDGYQATKWVTVCRE